MAKLSLLLGNLFIVVPMQKPGDVADGSIASSTQGEHMVNKLEEQLEDFMVNTRRIGAGPSICNELVHQAAVSPDTQPTVESPAVSPDTKPYGQLRDEDPREVVHSHPLARIHFPNTPGTDTLVVIQGPLSPNELLLGGGIAGGAAAKEQPLQPGAHSADLPLCAIAPSSPAPMRAHPMAGSSAPSSPAQVVTAMSSPIGDDPTGPSLSQA